MANKIVSLLLQVKNAISPGVKEAGKDLQELEARSRSLEKELTRLDNAKAAAQGLDAARDAAKEAEAAFDQAQREVIELKAALKSEKTPELALALEKANTAARAAKKEWQDSAKAVGQLEKSVKGAGGDLDDLATTQLQLGQQIDRTNGALRANKQQLDKARTGLNQTAAAAEKTGFSFGGLVAKAAALLGIVTVVDKVRDGLNSLAGKVYETGTQFELLGKRLSPEELGYIEEFARNTPLALDGVADAFLKLRTFGLDPTNGSLMALTDTAAAMGGGQQELEGIILAVGQAWSKQKLQQEEALQLIERGVPVWDLLADKIGKTAPELQKMATAGELGRREIQLLLDAMAERNAGQAQQQMSTLAGLVSNLQDRFTQFYREIADAGVWDYLKVQLRELSAWFDEMASNGQMQKLAKSISDGFIATAETLKAFVTGLYGARQEIAALAKAWIALKIASWVTDIKSATGAFGLLAGGVRQSKDAITGLGATLGTVATAGIGAFTKLGNAVKSTVSFLSKAGNAAVAGLAANVVTQTYRAATGYAALKQAVRELRDANADLDSSSLRLSDRLREISAQTGVAVTSVDQLNAAIASGAIVVDELTGRYMSAAQAAQFFAQQTAAAAEQQAISAERLSGAYQGVTSSLQDAIADNSKLASVMQGEVVKALNAGVEGVGGLALALKSAEQQGSLTADQIETELVAAIAKLSEPERQRFGALLADAMAMVENGADGAGVRVEYLQRLLDGLNTSRAEGALKRLGISQEELAGSISKGMQQALEDLQTLGQQIDGLGNVGNKAGGAVYTALSTALRNVRTEADKQQFQTALDGFRNAGRITQEQYDNLKDSVQGVGDAGEDAGERGSEGVKPLKDALQDVQETADDTSRDVRAVAASLAQFFQNVRAEVAALSEEAAAAFDNRLGIGAAADDMDELTRAITDARTELGKIAIDNLQVFDPTGVNRFKNAVLEAKNETIIAYSEQKQRFEQYLAALESGTGVTQSMINQAQTATQFMGLLGEQDLAQLRGALDDARQKLESISDAASNTLDQLQTELDRLQGNQDAINQRDYENKRKELQNAIEEAKRYGNQEAVRQYTEALKVLEDVRRERQKQANEQRQQQAQQRSSTSASQSTGSTTANRGTTINLQSATGNKSVQLNGDAKAVEQLLAVLEDAGLRSAG